MKEYLQSRTILLFLGLGWALFILAALTVLQKEEFTPVSAFKPLGHFPLTTDIPLAPDKPTLIVFAHPQCPCTRATFHELSQLLEATHDKISLVTVFTLPPGVPSGWEQGALLQMARNLPGNKIVLDKNGLEANRFHVIGSGTALLYSSTGQLLFSGGITPFRGHEGDNLGRSAITSLVLHGTASINHTPVFGCSLL